MELMVSFYCYSSFSFIIIIIGFLMDCLGVDFVLALSLLPHLLITDGVNG